jgi:hypothetical protein
MSHLRRVTDVRGLQKTKSRGIFRDRCSYLLFVVVRVCAMQRAKLFDANFISPRARDGATRNVEAFRVRRNDGANACDPIRSGPRAFYGLLGTS